MTSNLVYVFADPINLNILYDLVKGSLKWYYLRLDIKIRRKTQNKLWEVDVLSLLCTISQNSRQIFSRIHISPRNTQISTISDSYHGNIIGKIFQNSSGKCPQILESIQRYPKHGALKFVPLFQFSNTKSWFSKNGVRNHSRNENISHDVDI